MTSGSMLWWQGRRSLIGFDCVICFVVGYAITSCSNTSITD